MQLMTGGNPYIMSQAEQDNFLRNPRWVLDKIASASSATNSAYYFSRHP